MPAIEQYILEFPGSHGIRSRCHVVASRARAFAVAGQPLDNPGTSVTNALERVAKDVSCLSFDGGFGFQLFEFNPKGLPTGKPTFYRIEWRGGRPGQMPEWHVVRPASSPFLKEVEGLFRTSRYTTAHLRASGVEVKTNPSAEFRD